MSEPRPIVAKFAPRKTNACSGTLGAVSGAGAAQTARPQISSSRTGTDVEQDTPLPAPVRAALEQFGDSPELLGILASEAHDRARAGLRCLADGDPTSAGLLFVLAAGYCRAIGAV